MRTVCVFCGANPGNSAGYVQAAARMGRYLADTGRRLVYGGGRTGLMGALAEAALAGGGEVIGVMPRHLVEREVAHLELSELRIVDSMHERKALLADLADGFLAMPGGLGTLEELFEIWTWGQLGLHRKPFGLLETNGYFTPLLRFLDHAVEAGFISVENRSVLVVDGDPATLIARMEAVKPAPVRQWIDSAAT